MVMACFFKCLGWSPLQLMQKRPATYIECSEKLISEIFLQMKGRAGFAKDTVPGFFQKGDQ